MSKTPVVRIVLLLSVFALTSLIAVAADSHHGIVTSRDGRMSTATQAPSEITAPNEPAGLTTIAGNLSRYQFGVFFCCFGYTISGPDSFLGQTYWDAVPFTPTANVNVKAIEASVGWGFNGTNGVTLSLNADANGLPGNALGSMNLTDLEGYGQCCELAVAKDPAGFPVTAGTQYWVVVSTSTDTDATYDGWAMNSTDMRSHPFATYSGSTGWEATQGVLPGFAVLGN